MESDNWMDDGLIQQRWSGYNCRLYWLYIIDQPIHQSLQPSFSTSPDVEAIKDHGITGHKWTTWHNEYWDLCSKHGGSKWYTDKNQFENNKLSFQWDLTVWDNVSIATQVDWMRTLFFCSQVYSNYRNNRTCQIGRGMAEMSFIQV